MFRGQLCEIGAGDSLVIASMDDDALVADESFVAGGEGGEHVCDACCKGTASSDITGFSAHVADLAEFLCRLVALAVCGDGVGVEVAASACAISISWYWLRMNVVHKWPAFRG